MRFLTRVTICGNLTGKVARIKGEKERRKEKREEGGGRKGETPDVAQRETSR